MPMLRLCLKGFLSFSILFVLFFANAHPWHKVRYKVKVESIDKDKVSIIQQKILKYEGWIDKEWACRGKGDRVSISLSQVEKGLNLITRGAQLEAIYSSYSRGPLPKWAVVEDHPKPWAFYPLQKGTSVVKGECGSKVSHFWKRLKRFLRL